MFENKKSFQDSNKSACKDREEKRAFRAIKKCSFRNHKIANSSRTRDCAPRNDQRGLSKVSGSNAVQRYIYGFEPARRRFHIVLCTTDRNVASAHIACTKVLT